MSIPNPLTQGIRIALAITASTVVLSACSGGGGGGDSTAKVGPGPNGSYLFVSAPEFYFGTRDVGTTATQEIEIANRGGDVYPINALTIAGPDAEEFFTDVNLPVTLHPAERVRIGVSFQPVAEGRKHAELDIDFDTIAQVDAETNANEASFYRARDFENQGDYQASEDVYNDYLANDPVVELNKQRAAMKLPVISEAERYGSGDDFELYLDAMNARDDGALDAAVQHLDTLLFLYADSFLGDDALYLKAYIDLIDREDHMAALRSLQRLRADYPDTTYYDTALYAEALAQQGLGNHSVARSIYLDLRARHTGVDTFGVRLPKDNLVSRLWFDRASAGLENLDAA